MNHSSRSAVALLFAAPFIGCGSGDPAPVPVPAPAVQITPPVKTEAPAPPSKNPNIPADVSYQILSDGDDGPVRRQVEIKLNTKVTPEVLREIAEEVKAREERKHERTAIFYYLPSGFPETDGMPWATTHFKPTLEVKILGLSPQEEQALRGIKLDHKGKRIGAWLQDNQYKTLDLIYEDDKSIKLAEILSPTERTDSVMVELPSQNGRRFKKVKGSNIYDVDLAGNLRISNGEGKVFSAAKPMK